jgi:hypothetical protein
MPFPVQAGWANSAECCGPYRRADKRRGLVHCVRDPLGHSVINDLQLPVVGHHQVLGLDVPAAIRQCHRLQGHARRISQYTARPPAPNIIQSVSHTPMSNALRVVVSHAVEQLRRQVSAGGKATAAPLACHKHVPPAAACLPVRLRHT